MYDPELYRDKQEVEEWKKRDPIPTFIQRLKEEGLWQDDDWARMEQDVAQEIAQAIDFAEAGTWEPVAELTRFVYSEAHPLLHPPQAGEERGGAAAG
jgi:pyruvate dehydrogenase E1 component alpha subunit/2-oxoisovalerate dehydrogenase E1 component